MKRFYKVAAIVSGSALAIGLVCMIAGTCVGGTVHAAARLANTVPGVHVEFPFFWYDSQESIQIAQEDEISFGAVEQDVSIVMEDVGAYELNESYLQEITELDWEIGYGKITVTTGTEFSIQGKYHHQDNFESYVKNGIWYIECERDGIGWDSGLSFSLSENAGNHTEFIITIPENAQFESVEIELGAGEAAIDGIICKEAAIDVGAGTMKMENWVIQKEGEITVGTGNATLKNFTGRDICLDCGVGSINLEGNLFGESELDCGIGTMKLLLDGYEEDYNYEVSSGIGTVRLGKHKKYTGVTDKEVDNDAEDSFSIECGIGTITVEFVGENN